jgi:hypothetical protein
MSNQMIYVEKWFEPFLSEWGCWSHSSTDEPVRLPLGWEGELTARGIVFDIREDLERLTSNENNDNG